MSELAIVGDAPPARPRWRTPSLVGVAALAIGAVVGWSAAQVFVPPADPLEAQTYTYAVAEEGSVGQSLTLTTLADWKLVPVAANLAAGTVTSVEVADGQEVTAGSTLYTVNLRPVVVGTGSIPSFRAMTQGMDGADVAQLQAMLADLGYYSGEADGRFGGQTARAVRAWQKSLGLAPDGTVQAADIVFVPTLPTRVSLDPEQISRGSILAGGENAIRALPASPVFSIPVTEEQSAQVPNGALVSISGMSGDAWTAVVQARETSAEGDIALILAGENGGPICVGTCQEIPAGSPVGMPATVVLSEAVEGIVVPSAALLTESNGDIVVITPEGEREEVVLVASARGMSIVEGLRAGDRVRIPAGE